MSLPIDIFLVNLLNLTLGLIPVIVISVLLALVASRISKAKEEGKKMQIKKEERPTKVITGEDECFDCGCNLWKKCPGFKPENKNKKK
jgi:hypothetical protein